MHDGVVGKPLFNTCTTDRTGWMLRDENVPIIRIRAMLRGRTDCSGITSASPLIVCRQTLAPATDACAWIGSTESCPDGKGTVHKKFTHGAGLTGIRTARKAVKS